MSNIGSHEERLGAIVQPLFSAFGDESLFVRLEDAQTRAIITQRKHLPKVRRVCNKLPYLEYIIVVDHLKTKKLENKEIAFKPGWPSMMRAYWNNEEKYREKFVNGWYISGDKATSDNEFHQEKIIISGNASGNRVYG
jgi:acyl-coenzyme A synthetase/AMP-(fatty) acid ligase